MNIEKAIKNLEQLEYLFTQYLHRDFEKAYKMSIEALKRLERLRDIYGGSANELLPGETKE